jgi:hypothetical protein
MNQSLHRRGICLDTNNILFSKDDKNHSICAALGCYQLADTLVSLKIGEKSITIFVCEDCTHKFKES